MALANMDYKDQNWSPFWEEQTVKGGKEEKRKRKKKKRRRREAKQAKVWNLTLSMDFFYGILKFV